jgi:cardiolipin synthase A/B
MPTKSRRALAPLARARVIWGGGAAALTAVLILLWSNLSSPAPPVPPTIAHSYAAGDSQFIRVMSSLLGPPMVGGNRVRALLNGDQSFPAMVTAIRAARHSIDFESYIYWSGRVGREFADALSERARAGVPTHVLIDWAGSWIKSDREVLDRMRAAGVEVVMYRPLRWYDLDRINNRTHRVHRRHRYRRPVAGACPGQGPLAR